MEINTLLLVTVCNEWPIMHKFLFPRIHSWDHDLCINSIINVVSKPQLKNCDLFVFGPELAIDSTPGPACFRTKTTYKIYHQFPCLIVRKLTRS